MSDASVVRAHVVADELFATHASVFGSDLSIYQGHVHRVIGVVGLQLEISPDVAGALGVAAFFHDSGIWFDDTWDYLPSSTRRATAALPDFDASQHLDLVTALITEHHRIRHARHANPLVEAFRVADLADVTAGIVAPGVAREEYRALVDYYPAKGFRPMLVGAFWRGLRAAPLHPLPMVKL
ncbi:hypothetical protein [Mycolicibacterium sp.]|uniref:hypothetical protein n=1 Tax=Mycolicibacterium sp. TaxID=2320850 RepID=UPI001A29A183|nr:hypothetical protein [Mycolicibacterium sp.]MBJ7337971.1 hypothetical protein [Mycolicibacterium sp.]